MFGNRNLYDAIKRGLDYGRNPGTYSIHPYPKPIGMLVTFAPLSANVLHVPSPAPAPNQLTGQYVFGGVGQFGLLPKGS